jgi:stress-induced morphogen
MALNPDHLKELITKAFPDADIDLQDLRGDNDHYALKVASPTFVGKSRIQQHQMVYAALEGRMGNELHALAIQTSIPQGTEN